MKNTQKLITIVLGIAILSACKPDYSTNTDQASKPGPRPVRLQKLEVHQKAIPIVSSGKLASSKETQLSFKIGGIIDKMHVKEGQRVRKGQLLASLKPTEINAQVAQAENAYKKAKRDLERAQNLYDEKVATLEQLQNQTTAYELAKADLDIAHFNQEYALVKAPAAGIVLRTFTEEGELLSPGTPVIQLGNNSTEAMVMRIGVSDREIVRLQLQDTAHVYFDAYPQQHFNARVTEMAAASDPRSGTFEVELTLDATSLALRSGFIGKVKLYPASQEPYYQISMQALVEGHKDEASIFVANHKSKQVQKVKVTPQHIGNDFFTISASLPPAFDYVVTEGAAYLKDQDSIQILASR
ncbi:efflux RND transporter periplasmic adaptor subunit [Porifericola rhodea]|uniref:efflux RND transporter periplasmic adaptor subunit n=1 Tax=Porifericola rhodea TaxID=930972 RepID=UPI0026666757|nr:efflux RND transporter periplasmic adaptor subunit [Porifericola rhodea]WKN29710.1 efflux RND transporter periplasmic adaptor subunit [Porifericola rhodea]